MLQTENRSMAVSSQFFGLNGRDTRICCFRPCRTTDSIAKLTLGTQNNKCEVYVKIRGQNTMTAPTNYENDYIL